MVLAPTILPYFAIFCRILPYSGIHNILLNSASHILLNFTSHILPNCHGTDLTRTIAHCSILFPTVGWPTTSALAANLTYLYTLPLCTFFSSPYHNIVIWSTCTVAL